MDAEAYERFTQRLTESLATDDRVLGLVALGSMAAEDTKPDRWSDHDFFVVVRTGEQESFRTDLAWVPDASTLVLAYRETAHGLKALYKNGHLLEFAVFDPQELHLAKVNRYRVLLDRGGIADAWARAGSGCRARSARSGSRPTVAGDRSPRTGGEIAGFSRRGSRNGGAHARTRRLNVPSNAAIQ